MQSLVHYHANYLIAYMQVTTACIVSSAQSLWMHTGIIYACMQVIKCSLNFINSINIIYRYIILSVLLRQCSYTN